MARKTLFMVAVGVLILGVAAASFGEPRAGRTVRAELPELEQYDMGDGASFQFDWSGTVDRVDFESGQLVVGDSLFTLRRDTQFKDKEGRAIRTTQFREGDLAAIKVVPDTREVAELWRLDRGMQNQ
ncbi:MAG: hypothetical protein ACLFOY_01000 [Desulfatibacillaceae bacterium]